MKKSLVGRTAAILLAGLLVAPLLTGVARAGGGPGFFGSPSPQVIAPPSTGLTVVGSGVVSVKPDRAFVTVGVQSTAATATAAQNATARTTDAVIATLRAIAVVKDVHTVNVSLSPVYGEPGAKGGPAQVTGYQSVQTLGLTVTDVSRSGAVLDAAVKAGATTQMGISFGIADASAARAQALAQAVADARQQAQQVARAAGFTLKKMTALVVLPSSNSSPIYGAGGGGGTPILPGVVQVDAAVQMTFTY